MLNPEVDRVGVAVVSSRGTLYAVADYEREVPELSQLQVEATVANMVRVSGVTIVDDPRAARAACATESGSPAGSRAMFIMRWQGADLTHLPQALVDRLASGRYREAAVGSCPTASDTGAFTAYRLAVLLY